jgi:hypothetical protein
MGELCSANESDDDLIHAPDLIESRDKLASTLDVLANAVIEERLTYPRRSIVLLADR